MSGRVEESLVLDEEIAWLRSFGWNDHAIARRLRVTVEAIEQRDRRRWGRVSHHGNSHRSSTPGAVKRLRIEQAIARHGTPHKAAEATGYPLLTACGYGTG